MGYYYKNNYETVLTVSNDTLTSNFELCEGEVVEIVNNESIKFDFKNFKQYSNVGLILSEKEKEIVFNTLQEAPILLEKDSEPFVLEHSYFQSEDCLYKIIIDYKDGERVTLNKPLSKDDNGWLEDEHTFNFDKEITEDVIDIYFYNLYGFLHHVKLKFKTKNLSTYNKGIELSLVSANMDNDKNISYVFNNLNENQLILAKKDAIK